MSYPIPFAIRDDDLSYWTSIEEIEEAYGELFRLGIKVSFATIPKAVRTFSRGHPDKYYLSEHQSMPLGMNSGLVDYLRDLIAKKWIEIMLHGYDHIYHFTSENITYPQVANEMNLFNRDSNISWVPECICKSRSRLINETMRGKAYLETLLGCRITVFVPPSNEIGPFVNDLNMDLCAPFVGIRQRSLKDGFKLYIQSRRYRLFKHFDYPYAIRYRGHSEINAYSLTPSTKPQWLLSAFYRCSKEGAPFILATHHWELLERRALQETLHRIVEEAQKLRCDSRFVGEILSGAKRKNELFLSYAFRPGEQAEIIGQATSAGFKPRK